MKIMVTAKPVKKVLSGWMKRDGVLSSFHFNVFRNSV
jgi:hypothetical protein